MVNLMIKIKINIDIYDEDEVTTKEHECYDEADDYEDNEDSYDEKGYNENGYEEDECEDDFNYGGNCEDEHSNKEHKVDEPYINNIKTETLNDKFEAGLDLEISG